jgi:O-antigen/teichoic acid export membrane protein
MNNNIIINYIIKMKKDQLINILTILSILLFIIILSCLLYSYQGKNRNVEYFDSKNVSQQNLALHFENGTSGIGPTGTITFNKPFLNPPLVFTQVIGNSNSATNIFSVQVFNVTNTSFDYSVNQISNKDVNNSSGNFSISSLVSCNTQSFYWMAF